MSLQHLLGALLVGTAAVSVAVQSMALVRLLGADPRPGMVRTVVCRVIAAVVYIVVGMVSVARPLWAGLVGVGAFIGVQWMWWVNSVMDLRLATRTPTHRATRPSLGRLCKRHREVA